MKYFKTYKTYANEARVPIKLGDVTVNAHFKDGNTRDGKWATLKTSSPLVQFVIENSPLYNRQIFLESQIELEEKPAISLDEITNMAQLRDYLADEYNCNRGKIASPAALKAKVREFGLELPNMEW